MEETHQVLVRAMLRNVPTYFEPKPIRANTLPAMPATGSNATPIQNTGGCAITTPMQPTRKPKIPMPTAVQAATVWPWSSCSVDIFPLVALSRTYKNQSSGRVLTSGQHLGRVLAKVISSRHLRMVVHTLTSHVGGWVQL